MLPDAIFVQSHRDPLKVLASNCRLAVHLRGMSRDRVDPHEVGRSMLELLGDCVNRLLAFRAAQVRAFVSDPRGSLPFQNAKTFTVKCKPSFWMSAPTSSTSSSAWPQ